MEKKVLDKKVLGDATQTTIQLYNTDKSNITIEEVSAIIDRFSTGGSKIMVRGLNIERMSTLKTMDGEFDLEAFVGYYRNSVREIDIDKFTTFRELQITVFKPNTRGR
jgi:hypothetical protein